MGELAKNHKSFRDSIPVPEEFNVSYDYGFLVSNPKVSIKIFMCF